MVGTLNSSESMIDTIADGPVGTGILAFRDLKKILSKYVNGKYALDFGCGAGRSSRFLKGLGFTVTGVDISKEMLTEAKSRGDDIEYKLVQPLNFDEDLSPEVKYNLIFISFVIMEISSKDKIIEVFDKLKNFLQPEGKIVVIAASDKLYTGRWLSINTDSPENKSAKSGEVVKVYLKDYDLEINDYLWKENDCELFFRKSNLTIINKTTPLGNKEDQKPWIDELKQPPFVIYVLKPSISEESL